MFSLTYGDSLAVKNEILAIAKLCNGQHSNFVWVLSCGEFRDLSYAFIDMEILDLNLDDYIKSLWIVAKVDGELKGFQIWNVMMQIGSGLSYMHDNKTIHGDLKPSNGKTS